MDGHGEKETRVRQAWVFASDTIHKNDTPCGKYCCSLTARENPGVRGGGEIGTKRPVHPHELQPVTPCHHGDDKKQKQQALAT